MVWDIDFNNVFLNSDPPSFHSSVYFEKEFHVVLHSWIFPLLYFVQSDLQMLAVSAVSCGEVINVRKENINSRKCLTLCLLQCLTTHACTMLTAAHCVC